MSSSIRWQQLADGHRGRLGGSGHGDFLSSLKGDLSASKSLPPLAIVVGDSGRRGYPVGGERRSRCRRFHDPGYMYRQAIFHSQWAKFRGKVARIGQCRMRLVLLIEEESMAVVNSADSRMRERIFVMWEEAGGNPVSAYRLWHKIRPMLREESTADSVQHMRRPMSASKAKSRKHV